MTQKPSVSLDDLESALQWVSAAAPFENAAYISKMTGQIFYSSVTHGTEDELPEDVDDASLYWSVPHNNDLDLGRTLAYRYAEEMLPQEYSTVQEIFHRRGAYARYKDLLERRGHLESWYEYERSAIESALLAWAEESGLRVTAQDGTSGA
jgi:hypothetical protein